MKTEYWLILIALAYFFFWPSKVKKGRKRTRPAPDRELRVPPVFTWPALGDYDFEVVGESRYQPALRALAGDHGSDAAELKTTAVLVPDDTNPHDDKAVKVVIDGYPVGHLSREDARSYRRRLATRKQGLVAAQCGALIMGGFVDRNGRRAHYGVRLDMKPFD